MTPIYLLEDYADVTALCTRVGFNVCSYAGARAAQVAADLAELSSLTGVSPEQIFIPRQTHSTRVALPGDILEGVDALVSNRPGQLLCISTADCLPLLLLDPVARVVGAAHCGWRGTVGGIAAATLLAMTRLGAKPRHVIAAIGPHICPECFEVGEEVAAQFPPEAVSRKPGQKPRVDLARAVAMQLGPEVTIRNPHLCSMHNAGFYSVRRQGRDLPFRTLSAIALKA